MKQAITKTNNSLLRDMVTCIGIFVVFILIAVFLLYTTESKAFFEASKRRIYLAYPFHATSTSVVLLPEVISPGETASTPDASGVVSVKPIVNAPEDSTHENSTPEDPVPQATTTPTETIPEIPPKIKTVFLVDDGIPAPQDFSTLPLSNWSIATGTLNLSIDNFVIGSRSKPVSLTYLNGSYSWDNYLAEVVVDWKEGNEFSIVARFDSPLDYVTCTFLNYGQHAVINAYRDGEHVRSMKSVELPVVGYAPWLNNKYSARISGNTITCLVGEESILTGTIPKGLVEGSFGFKVQDSGKTSASVHIKSLKVTPF